MKCCPLKDCTEKSDSWNPATKASNDEIVYIDIAAIDKDTKKITSPSYILGKDAPSRARQIIKTGDVLVSTVRPNLNSVALVTEDFNNATASTGYTVIRPLLDKLDSNYLFHWVKTSQFISEMVQQSSGASYPAVSDKIVLNSEIPLPPLPEQRRIAAILDKADELRQKRRQAIEKLDQLLQATFIDMFGDPVSNPKGWDKVALHNICTQIVDCPHSTPEWTQEGIICLRTSNLTKGGWIWEDTRYISFSEYQERTKRSKIYEGDIILSREGTIGIAAIVPENLQLSLGQRLVQLTPDSKRISSEFLLQVLLYDLDPIRISTLLVGSTSKHINVKDLRALKVYIPPHDSQKKFSMLSKYINEQKIALKKSLVKLDDLFTSLQQRAFSGNL